MATIKVKFRPSSVEGKSGTVYYQLCHKGESSQITTKIHLLPAQWDTENEHIAESRSKEDSRLQRYRRQIDGDCSYLRKIIRQLDGTNRDYALSDVVSLFHSSSEQVTLLAFMQEQIDECRKYNHLGTARNYQRTLNSFSSFLSSGDIPFALVNEELVAEYEAWLAARGVVRNSSSFYLRCLRSIYNKAVRLHLAEQSTAFQNVYTGIDRTRKRAVGEQTIINLQRLDLEYSRPLSLARDLFVFSYCTRGMAFVDIAFLRKEDIQGDTISYVRRKTGQRLNIRIEPCMAQIIARYAAETAKSVYVFQILSSEEPERAYEQYQIALSYHNRKLKRIGALIGENLSLSSYTARHSWATAARRHNVPISVISEGMGHTSEKTTQIYLASLENSVIDKANRALLGHLNCVVSI